MSKITLSIQITLFILAIFTVLLFFNYHFSHCSYYSADSSARQEDAVGNNIKDNNTLEDFINERFDRK